MGSKSIWPGFRPRTSSRPAVSASSTMLVAVPIMNCSLTGLGALFAKDCAVYHLPHAEHHTMSRIAPPNSESSPRKYPKGRESAVCLTPRNFLGANQLFKANQWQYESEGAKVISDAA